jgi:peptide/nickel transport system substrate-binding protein
MNVSERNESASGIVETVERLSRAARNGELNRRQLLKRAMALGLSAPVIAGLLAACGGDDDDDGGDEPAATTGSGQGEATTAADEPTEAADEPTAAGDDATEASGDDEPTEATDEATSEATTEPAGEAGGGGLLRILQWQAPTILNPHLSTGYKDYDAARISYQPLADFDINGDGIPVLAAEFPTVENGSVSEDGLSVTWTLREGVTWHDGEPFTSADVKFTWEYAADPETAAVTAGAFRSVASIDTPDDLTVVVTFTDPNPAGFEVFTGRNGMIIPEHIFREFMGADSRNAPANLEPVGTGPFMVTEFRPGDVVLYERYEGYWDAGKPYFDSVELKGGGDSLGAARAVLQTGEADFAWGAGGDPAVLAELERAGNGVIVRSQGITGDRLCIQFADPNTEVDGARAEPTTQHPLFQNKDIREAISLIVPRDVLADEVYGNGAVATANNLAAPLKFNSPNTTWTYDMDAAKALVANFPEVQGYKLLFQTSILSTRQKSQEVIKQGLEELGFQVELKSVDASVFFSSDVGNPDTYTKFYADLEIFTYAPDSLYPINYMTRYRSDSVCQKSNNWATLNVTRYQNPEYDALHDQARVEMDPDAQVELFIAMNDLSVEDIVEIPLVLSGGGPAASNALTGYETTPWTSNYHDIANWRMAE